MLTRLGWLVFHHGVQSADLPGSASRWRYSAGAFVLDSQDLTQVIWRSPSPLLTPVTQDEAYGVVDNVVFPTGVDVVDERTLDLYYGMADARIGAARVRLNERAALHRLDRTASHAQFLAQKITALGGLPTAQPRPVPTAATNREIVENVLKAERQTIAAYTERVQQADAYGDIALRAELETQIQDETRHAEELEKVLRNWRD
jgi:bacterioferritin (cytochrome b1)